MNYNGHKLVVEQFVALGIAMDSKILDLAAGTGLVGSVLTENGYTNIDALDGSVDMLGAAKKRQCYGEIFTHFIKRETKLPFEDHSYDHIIMSGALCHIDYETLPQIIQVCKPGTHQIIKQLNEELIVTFRNELQAVSFVGQLDSPRILYAWSQNSVTDNLKITLKAFVQKKFGNSFLVSRKRLTVSLWKEMDGFMP